MKTLIMALASVALLSAPMAASAQGFGGRGGGHMGGFGGGSAGGHAAAPAFHGGPAANDGFRGAGFRGPAFGIGYRGGGWAIGAVLPALYWDAYLSDPFDYGLVAAPYGCHWVAVNGEALLIDNATGAIVQVAPL